MGLRESLIANIYMGIWDPWLGGSTKGTLTSKVQIYTEVVQGLKVAFAKRLLELRAAVWEKVAQLSQDTCQADTRALLNSGLSRGQWKFHHVKNWCKAFKNSWAESGPPSLSYLIWVGHWKTPLILATSTLTYPLFFHQSYVLTCSCSPKCRADPDTWKPPIKGFSDYADTAIPLAEILTDPCCFFAISKQVYSCSLSTEEVRGRLGLNCSFDKIFLQRVP